MNKLIKLVTFLLLFVSIFTLTACHDGSVDELYGIYGLSSLYYKDADGYTHNYADKFDYIVMVVNEGGTIDLYSKVNGAEEIEYHFTYTINYSEDEEKKEKNIVTSIKLNEFIKLSGYKKESTAEANGYSFVMDDSYSMNFGSLTNKLKHLDWGFDKNKDNETKSTFYRNNYEKLYDRISDRLIEKAKNKQIKDRDERLSKIDSES